MRIRDFVAKLQEIGDLAVIDEEVAREQIPLMIKHEEAGHNRAILFRHIRGHSVPIVANLYGSYGRYALASIILRAALFVCAALFFEAQAFAQLTKLNVGYVGATSDNAALFIGARDRHLREKRAGRTADLLQQR